MRILWLSHLVPYPPKGGVLQRSFNMIKELSKYHEITLVAFNQAHFLAASLPDQDDPLEFSKDALRKYVKSIHVFPIPEEERPAGRYLTAMIALASGQAYNMVWLASSWARQKIVELLSNESFDAVHIDTISLCIYFDLLDGLPVILNHHNFESEMLGARSKTEKSFLKGLYYRLESSRLLKSETRYCRQSMLNLTCSNEDAQSMRSAIGDNGFKCVPNGVDISYFYPNASVHVDERSIVIVGGLSWYPNREAVEYFIREIWPLVRERVPNISAHIVGRGPTDEMLELAENDDSFHVHGFVDDVRDYLWRAHFYLCPIRSGGGTKLKILDALASGCCIIADPFACKGIEVRDKEEVLFAEDPNDYVDAIENLLNNPGIEARLRDAGPNLIQSHHSYNNIGKDYSDALEGVVQEFKERRRST